jgi:hypothetical protein
MAKQTFTTGQVLTAAQMTSLQETAMGGGPATAKTANYVLVAADAGTTVAMDAAGATTITVNTGLFAAGDTVFIQNLGAGACTITAGTATVATAGSLILPQNDAGILYFTSASAAIFYDYIQVGATSPLTTKGDLYTFGTSDTRLPVGTNGHTLVADSAEATGLKWAAPAAGGGFTQLASTTPSTATTSFTTISGSHKHLCLVFQDVYASSDNQPLSLTLNGISTSTYSYARIFDTAGTYGQSNAYATTSIAMAGVTNSATATNKAVGVIWFYNYATSGAKSVDWKLVYNRTSAGSFFVMGEGFNTTASAISQIDLTVGAGTWSGGTMTLYGVS